MNLLCSFDMIPGLVIDLMGQPAIVIENDRDLEREIAHLTLNTPEGDQKVSMSWANADSIRVLGVAVNMEPDNISLFEK